MIDIARLPDDQRLNYQQVCEVLDCGKTHFYHLVNTGQLQAVRLGRRKGIKVRAIDLRAYLAQQEYNGLEETPAQYF